MRTEQSRIEPDAANPFGHEAGVLAGCHAMVDMPAAREHKLAWLLARRSQVIFDRLPCLLGQLELDWPSGLSLPNRCSLNGVAVRRNVLDFEGHHIAAAELAVDGQIEHGEVTDPALDHQLGSDKRALAAAAAWVRSACLCSRARGDGHSTTLIHCWACSLSSAVRTGSMRGNTSRRSEITSAFRGLRSYAN